MSHQLRVLDLLPSKKSGAELRAKATGKAGLAAAQQQHGRAKSQQLQTKLVQPPTTPSTRTTRSRSTARITAEPPPQAEERAAATVPLPPSTPHSKRKAINTLDRYVTPSKKAKNDERGEEEEEEYEVEQEEEEASESEEEREEEVRAETRLEASPSPPPLESAPAPLSSPLPPTTPRTTRGRILSPPLSPISSPAAELASTAPSPLSPSLPHSIRTLSTPAATTTRFSALTPGTPSIHDLDGELEARVSSLLSAKTPQRMQARPPRATPAASPIPSLGQPRAIEAPSPALSSPGWPATPAAASRDQPWAASPAIPPSPASSSLSGLLPFTAAPITSSADLQSRISDLLSGVLPLPVQLTLLLRVFHGLDSTLVMLLARNKGVSAIPWEKELQPAIQRVVGRNVHLAMVQQLCKLYPGCYNIEEKHSVNSLGKIHIDYKISIGQPGAAAAETPSAGARAVLHTSANLAARRKEVEQRMLLYVFEQHRKYLSALLKEPHSADMREAITAFLHTPVEHLHAWYPSFQLDSSAHVPPLPMVALPSAQLEQIRQKQEYRTSGSSLLELSRRRQSIPTNLSLSSELKGVQNSTSHGMMNKDGATAAAAAIAPSPPSTPAAAASSSSLPAASPSPRPAHKSLSVLDPKLLSQFSARVESQKRESLQQHGDPAEREHLRSLHKLRGLYEAISMRLRTERRPNMPVQELITKLKASGDHGEPATIRAHIDLLVQFLPRWCSIGSSGTPPREIFRTISLPSLIMDPKTGRDRNIQTLEAKVREFEQKMAEQAAGISIGVATVSQASSQPAAATPIQVKQEEVGDASMSSTSVSSSAPPPPAAAAASSATSTSTNVHVKAEEEATRVAAASAAASSIVARTAARMEGVAAAPASPLRLSSSSPAKRATGSSRAMLMAQAAAAARAANPPKPDFLSRLAASQMR